MCPDLLLGDHIEVSVVVQGTPQPKLEGSPHAAEIQAPLIKVDQGYGGRIGKVLG